MDPIDTSSAPVEGPQFSILAIGALYRDVIVKVPKFPAEDAKQSATSEKVRVGGNISNTLSVLSQVVAPGTQLLYATAVGGPEAIWRPLISALEAKGITMLYEIREGEGQTTPTAYIFESESTGSRTIISHQLIPQLKTSEVKSLLFTHFFPKSTFMSYAYDDMLSRVYNAHSSFYPSWIHFEGRECFMVEGVIDHFIGRREYKQNPCVISAEFEAYGRPGLGRLMGMCDVAFIAEGYMKGFLEEASKGSWDGGDKEFMVKMFTNYLKRTVKRRATAFITVGSKGAYAVRFNAGTVEMRHIPAPEIAPSEIVETTGAGDTFIGAAIYALGYRRLDAVKAAKIAVNVASKKCMLIGYDGLGNPDGGFGVLEGEDPFATPMTGMSPAPPVVRPMDGLL
ncbi:uncharacterized protein DFL_003670 [Arthrobotrys flagrans]|uniref:Carbohydrate kinase PfkB domain-containing protein n=1 Tax=Arthrobotrys flagrans TaxID=97331 RepID=A0A437A2I4_ARTFL|nr:hypothetical protein DFL_003670 [Arthrobotrys flagrans]